LLALTSLLYIYIYIGKVAVMKENNYRRKRKTNKQNTIRNQCWFAIEDRNFLYIHQCLLAILTSSSFQLGKGRMQR
jgi:hypothetical protein